MGTIPGTAVWFAVVVAVTNAAGHVKMVSLLNIVAKEIEQCSRSSFRVQKCGN